jgi:hypothetical protein
MKMLPFQNVLLFLIAVSSKYYSIDELFLENNKTLTLHIRAHSIWKITIQYDRIFVGIIEVTREINVIFLTNPKMIIGAECVKNSISAKIIGTSAEHQNPHEHSGTVP